MSNKKKKHNAGDGLPHAWIGAVVKGLGASDKMFQAGKENLERDEYGNIIDSESNRKQSAWAANLNPYSSLKNVLTDSELSKQQKWGIIKKGLWKGSQEYIETKGRQAESLEEQAKTEEGYNRALSNSLRYDRNIPTFPFGGNIGSNPNMMNESLEVDNIEGYGHEEGGTNIGNIVEAEKGETKVEDYIFSDRLKLKAKDVKKYDLPNSYKNKTFAQVSKSIEDKLSKRKGDSLDAEEKERQLTELMNAQEDIRQIMFTNQATEMAETYPDFIKALGGSLSVPPDDVDKKPIEYPYSHIKKTEQEPYIREPISDASIEEYQQRYKEKNMFYPDSEYTKEILQLDQDLEMSEFYLDRINKANEEMRSRALGGSIADPPIPRKGKQYLTKEEKIKYEKDKMLEAIIKNRNKKSIKNPMFGSFELPKEKKKAWAGGSFRYDEDNIENSKNEGMDWAYTDKYQFDEEDYNKYSSKDSFDDVIGNKPSGVIPNTIEDSLNPVYSDKNNILEKEEVSQQGSGDTLKGIGKEIGLQAGNIFDVARGTIELFREDKKLDRVKPQTVSVSYLDPNQSLLDIKSAFNVAEDSISQQTSDVGSILAARLGLASSEAKNVAGVRSQYEQQNVQISNRAKMFNAQMQAQAGKTNLDQSNYEEMINQQRRDIASNMIQSGLSNAAEIYGSRVRDKEMERVQKKVISMIGSDDLRWDITLNKAVMRDYQGTGVIKEFTIEELMNVTGCTEDELHSIMLR